MLKTLLFYTRGQQMFQKIYEPAQNLKCQKGDMKQVPHWGTTNSRQHNTKYSSPGDLAHLWFTFSKTLTIAHISYKTEVTHEDRSLLRYDTTYIGL